MCRCETGGQGASDDMRVIVISRKKARYRGGREWYTVFRASRGESNPNSDLFFVIHEVEVGLVLVKRDLLP